MLSASAAPRWKRQINTFPFGALSKSIPNAVRRRKLGLSPIVTSANAPDLTNALRSILDYLKVPRAYCASDHCCALAAERLADSSASEIPVIQARAPRSA